MSETCYIVQIESETRNVKPAVFISHEKAMEAASNMPVMDGETVTVTPADMY